MTDIPPAPAPVRARPRPLERLEAEIVELATQLTSATARLLVMIGEFDAAEGWREWGMRSTAHWLSWQCGIGMTAGREQVRVARALRRLPVVSAAFHEGRLSYSKVRAVTRFATAENETELVQLAETATAAQMEQLQAAMRRVRTPDELRERHAARGVRYHYDDDGSLVGTFRLPPEDGAVFLQAMDVARGRVQELVIEGEDASAKASSGESTVARTTADALVLMANRLLADASAEAPAEAAERFQLVLHSTAEALARPDDSDDRGGAGTELADGTRLHPATARRLTCDCPVTAMADGLDGSAVHVGRRTRRIRGRLLRAVHARDRGRCRAPGCTERATQIHHIRHWANGGSTCLRNLISLCDSHHWHVHEGGFTIVTRRPGEWALLSPAGVTVEARSPAPVACAPLPHDTTLAPDAVSGHWDGQPLRVQDACGALITRRSRPTNDQVPSEVVARPEPRAADLASPFAFSPELMAHFVDSMREMQRRGETSAHIINLDDYDDE